MKISKLHLYNNTIVSIFFFFLAFSYALTISVGFPLKVSEIALAILFFLILIKGKLRIYALHQSAHTYLLLFILFVTASTLINLFWTYEYTLNKYENRFGYKFDSLLKLAYVLLAYLAFVISSNALTNNPHRFLNAFRYGAIVASIYAWHLFLFSFLSLPVINLPGMDEFPQVVDFFGRVVIRSGTFKEGNYMGLFLLVAGITALYSKNNKSALFFFVTLITTVSTISILCLILFLTLHYFYSYFNRRNLLKLILLLIVGLISLLILLQFQAFRAITVDKVFANTSHISQASYSKADRLNTLYTSVNITKSNPIFGVGMSNFALHYSKFNADKRFENEGFKVIPNNVYAELLSETGIIGFFLFMVFLYSLYKTASWDESMILKHGLIVILVYFVAFPTFTLLYIWFYFGLIASIKNTHSLSTENALPGEN